MSPGVAGADGHAVQRHRSDSSPVNHYVIFRQTDLASSTAWQPGASGKNWAHTLFSGGTAFAKCTVGLADVAAAGTTPSYPTSATSPRAERVTNRFLRAGIPVIAALLVTVAITGPAQASSPVPYTDPPHRVLGPCTATATR